MSATSLWPDFKLDAKPRGMRHILLDAGADVDQKTNSRVYFSVETVPSDAGLSYHCFLISRGDPRYKVELFAVHTKHQNFPANLYSADGGGVGDIPDEATLLKHLEQIFNSERTKQIVLNMISNFG